MHIVRHDPWLIPFARWGGVLDEDWTEENRDMTVYETDNELIVKANVAGVPVDNVDVSIESGVITIKADHQETEEEKKKRKVVYREARRAQYVYTTNIPCPVKAEEAKAEVTDGVLTLTLPKAPEAKLKKIKVTAKGK